MKGRKGYFFHSNEHSLAAKGVSTKRIEMRRKIKLTPSQKYFLLGVGTALAGYGTGLVIASQNPALMATGNMPIAIAATPLAGYAGGTLMRGAGEIIEQIKPKKFKKEEK